MVLADWFILAAVMLILVVPVLAFTWHSIRSDHHTPPGLQERRDPEGERDGAHA